MLSKDYLEQLKAEFDNTDTTEPVLYTEGDRVVAVGDANNTTVKKHDYTLVFETKAGEKVTKEYKNIHILPRKRMKCTNLLVRMLPYLYKPQDDGSIGEYTNLELAQMYLGMGDEIYDSMYELAQTVLDIPDELIDWVDPISVIVFSLKLIHDNPAVRKEAELSFV